jgi:hypothetical protein
MSDHPEMGIVSPSDQTLIERVLQRLDHELLAECNPGERAKVALDLFRCGFRHEDQLFEQVLTTLASHPRLR